jgi:predicted pyridoxine 5'-phosphate oxidase superfamily flavin-nucleotide-binding protein
VAFVPGVDETLRFRGRGSVVTDPELLAGTEVRGRLPLVGIKIEITRVFFHCGKALMRSDLWGGRYKIERSEFPSFAQILRDQNWDGTLDTIQERIDESYTNQLY